MKIGLFTDTYKPQINGVVTAIDVLAKELSKNHDVYIFAPKVPGHEDRKKNVFRYSSFKFLFQPEYRIAVPYSIKEIEDLHLDVIHTHTPFSIGILGAFVAKKNQIPLIHTYHTLIPEYVHYITSYGKPLTTKVAEKVSALYCNLCDVVIAPSKNVKKLLKKYGVKRRIEIIPSTIKEPLEVSTKEIKRKFGLDNKKVLLFVGRLGKEKNVDFLLRVFKKVNNKDPDTHLLIVSSGPERKNLENLALELNVPVTFTGYLSDKDLARCYKAADIFVFASTTETQGLVLLEAMSYGKPFVAVKAGGINIPKGGLMAKCEEKDFANKVLKVLKNDKLRKRLGKEGREYVKEFSPTNKLLKLYKEMMK